MLKIFGERFRKRGRDARGEKWEGKEKWGEKGKTKEKKEKGQRGKDREEIKKKGKDKREGKGKQRWKKGKTRLREIGQRKKVRNRGLRIYTAYKFQFFLS